MATNLVRESAELIRLAGRDLARIWTLVGRGVTAGEALHDLLPAIITQYGEVGGTLAAEWYDEQRLKVGAKRRFVASPLTPGDRGAHSLIGWAMSTATDDAGLHALIAGGVQRRVLAHVRGTITAAAVADPAADGWQRVGFGECKFCEMLIGRGAVYSEATVDFAAHDDCKCSAVPAWGGKPRDVREYEVGPRRKLDEKGNPIPDADFERAKKWIAEHM